MAGIKGMFGAEVTSYSSEVEKARRESLAGLTKNAERTKANAVIGTYFETSDIPQGTLTVFLAYGTAVVIKPAENPQTFS